MIPDLVQLKTKYLELLLMINRNSLGSLPQEQCFVSSVRLILLPAQKGKKVHRGIDNDSQGDGVLSNV